MNDTARKLLEDDEEPACIPVSFEVAKVLVADGVVADGEIKVEYYGSRDFDVDPGEPCVVWGADDYLVIAHPYDAERVASAVADIEARRQSDAGNAAAAVTRKASAYYSKNGPFTEWELLQAMRGSDASWPSTDERLAIAANLRAAGFRDKIVRASSRSDEATIWYK